MIAAERETTITMSDSDELVTIWTCQKRVLTRLANDSRFHTLNQGIYPDGTPWGEFTIPAKEWNPISGAKRRRKPMTEEQKAAAAARLARAREQKATA